MRGSGTASDEAFAHPRRPVRIAEMEGEICTAFLVPLSHVDRVWITPVAVRPVGDRLIL